MSTKQLKRQFQSLRQQGIYVDWSILVDAQQRAEQFQEPERPPTNDHKKRQANRRLRQIISQIRANRAS